jgi:microcystin-dependent protein
MANYEATRYDFDGANLTGIEGIPTATIVPWSDSAVPSGFLECDGAAVSRSTYSALFSIIGTTYGSGDGSTTFNVPDLQDNVPVGKSGTKAVGSTGGSNNTAVNGNVATNTNVTGNVATNVSSNASGGTANASLSTPQLASHSHSRAAPGTLGGYFGPARGGVASPPTATTNTGNTGGGGGHSHNLNVNVSSNASSNLSANASSASNFTGDAASTLQPYLTIIYIIKT